LTTPVLHPVVRDVTERIRVRSAETRRRYLERIGRAARRRPARLDLGCANLAHGFAACESSAKDALRGTVKANVAIVSSYNDMLSAHQPYETFPRAIKGPDGSLVWRPGPAESLDPQVLRPITDPFTADGGLCVLWGNLGRAVIKVSAVARSHRVVTAPARVFDDQANVVQGVRPRRIGPRRRRRHALPGVHGPTGCPSCTSSRRRDQLRNTVPTYCAG
jgi:dihydroxyacid dehydratase/phosphogluconate dehydratase